MKHGYPKTVVFVRHAESEENTMTIEERVAVGRGTNHCPISSVGVRQTEIAGEWLREHFPEPDAIYRSYYKRVKQTSDICYPGVMKRTEGILGETNRGVWYVYTEEQIKREMPWEILRRKLEGDYHYRPVGGENWPDTEERVRAFRRRLRNGQSGDTVVIFGHGTWHLLWRKLLNKWDDDETMERYYKKDIVANASVSIYHGRFDPVTGWPILVHDPAKDYIVPWLGRI